MTPSNTILAHDWVKGKNYDMVWVGSGIKEVIPLK